MNTHVHADDYVCVYEHMCVVCMEVCVIAHTSSVSQMCFFLILLHLGEGGREGGRKKGEEEEI